MLGDTDLAGGCFCRRLCSGTANRAKQVTKRRNALHTVRKKWGFANIVAALSPQIASVVCNAILSHWGRMACLKQSMVFLKNLHCFWVNVARAFMRMMSVGCAWELCFQVFSRTLHYYLDRQVRISISLWIV